MKKLLLTKKAKIVATVADKKYLKIKRNMAPCTSKLFT